MKKFFHEFKEFAMRGNVLDMAIGVVIGAAFGIIGYHQLRSSAPHSEKSPLPWSTTSSCLSSVLSPAAST